MKRILFAIGSLLYFLRVSAVFAQTQPVVLRAMSAVPAEGSEWIALENTLDATVSAQVWALRDVQGSIKTWWVPVLQPYELKMFTSAETKISLNNTGDQVELLQGGVVVQSSAPYEDLPAGALWVLLSDGWQEMDTDEWERRWPTRDWQHEVFIASPSPQASALPLASPLPSAKPTPSPVPTIASVATGSRLSEASPLVSKQEDDWWDEVVLPSVVASATQSALPVSTPPIWERQPGNFDVEWRTFQSWKQEIWYRLGLIFFVSLLTLALSAPKLYRCYNDVCLFDDG